MPPDMNMTPIPGEGEKKINPMINILIKIKYLVWKIF